LRSLEQSDWQINLGSHKLQKKAQTAILLSQVFAANDDKNSQR